jgi:hypothetical protein
MKTTEHQHLLRDADLSTLRGIPPPATAAQPAHVNVNVVEGLPGLLMADTTGPSNEMDHSELEEELEALAELVPGLRTGKVGVEAVIQQETRDFDLHLITALLPQQSTTVYPPLLHEDEHEPDKRSENSRNRDEAAFYEQEVVNETEDPTKQRLDTLDDTPNHTDPQEASRIHRSQPELDPLIDEEDGDENSPFRLVRRQAERVPRDHGSDFSDDPAVLNQLYKETSSTGSAHPPATQSPFGRNEGITQEPSISAASTATPQNDAHTTTTSSQNSPSRPFNNARLNMPMHLPNFKPATGCTNASDYTVRCFVARLRSGITVMKHGRSRWSKSQLRTLYILPDGRTLTWRPAILDASPRHDGAYAQRSRRRRPTELDLLTCTEVRHAWSADPSNPMFTGTPVLRQKCEAAFAHKSFALIFEKRTVDVTAVTADQCKVLLEGFSALCFRLQLAQLASVKSDVMEETESKVKNKVGEGEDDRTTASVTLTNNSTVVVAGGSGTRRALPVAGSKKGLTKKREMDTSR